MFTSLILLWWSFATLKIDLSLPLLIYLHMYFMAFTELHISTLIWESKIFERSGQYGTDVYKRQVLYRPLIFLCPLSMFSWVFPSFCALQVPVSLFSLAVGPVPFFVRDRTRLVVCFNAVDDCLLYMLSSLIISFRIHSSLEVPAARPKASSSIASNLLLPIRLFSMFRIHTSMCF